MTLLLLASSVQDSFDRFGPLAFVAIAGFIAYLRFRDRRRGPDDGDPDDEW